MTDDSIYLLKDSGNLEKVFNRTYDSEDLLQELIEKYPELLAGEQINPDEPVRWLLIKREAGIPDGDNLSDRWSVDHLLLDQNGVPTFVETKRSSDTRIRREVVGQMLDYAANSQKYWPVNRIRDFASLQYSFSDGADTAILKLIGRDGEQDTSDIVESFWTKVEDNLRNGKIRLFFVADQLPGELKRIIEFLNEQMNNVEVLGVELPQFVGSDFRALVPRLIGQTEIIRQTKQKARSSSRKTNPEEFLLKIPEYLRPFLIELISEAERQGMQISWGIQGFGLRLETNNGHLISLFYGWPGNSEGENPHIQGYVGSIEDEDLRNEIKQKFLSVEGTILAGKYTLDLDLVNNDIENAKKLVEVLWSIIKDPRLKGLKINS
ncbi:MAG TPA: hypothetical protein DCR71_05640 [Dehalococcoidia bacterium]|nr:hypothetical protein [Dehalococcoidia bacterium]HAS28477.1 hypothetical protein [Dehalococcoidia bacterium]